MGLFGPGLKRCRWTGEFCLIFVLFTFGCYGDKVAYSFLEFPYKESSKNVGFSHHIII